LDYQTIEHLFFILHFSARKLPFSNSFLTPKPHFIRLKYPSKKTHKNTDQTKFINFVA